MRFSKMQGSTDGHMFSDKNSSRPQSTVKMNGTKLDLNSVINKSDLNHKSQGRSLGRMYDASKQVRNESQQSQEARLQLSRSKRSKQSNQQVIDLSQHSKYSKTKSADNNRVNNSSHDRLYRNNSRKSQIDSQLLDLQT